MVKRATLRVTAGANYSKSVVLGRSKSERQDWWILREGIALQTLERLRIVRKQLSMCVIHLFFAYNTPIRRGDKISVATTGNLKGFRHFASVK